MKNIARKLHKYRTEIIRFCNDHEKVHLFGAGYVANNILCYLNEEGIEVSDVLVSDGQRVERKFHDLDVFEISEIEFSRKDGIILGVRPELQEEIKKNLYSFYGISDTQVYGQMIYYNFSTLRLMEGNLRALQNTTMEFERSYFESCVELDKIGRKNRTDKASDGHGYLSKYEFFLSKFKGENPRILELGIYKGASLKTWEDYFDDSVIYGVDIDEKCRKYGSKRCNIVICDLSEERELEKLAEIRPDICIDDASHIWSHQIKAFYHIFPRMPRGGVYVIEDLERCFAKYRYMGYDDAPISSFDFLSCISEVVTSGEFLRENWHNVATENLREEIEFLASQIDMMCFMQGSCIIIKSI